MHSLNWSIQKFRWNSRWLNSSILLDNSLRFIRQIRFMISTKLCVNIPIILTLIIELIEPTIYKISIHIRLILFWNQNCPWIATISTYNLIIIYVHHHASGATEHCIDSRSFVQSVFGLLKSFFYLLVSYSLIFLRKPEFR